MNQVPTRNHLLIIVGLAIVVAMAGYLGYLTTSESTNITSPPPPTTRCLGDDDVARYEAGVRPAIVVFDGDTEVERYRVELPTSTLWVDNTNRCSMGVVVGRDYDVTKFRSQVYNLPAGGVIEYWRYSYDGEGEKAFVLVDNSGFSEDEEMMTIVRRNQTSEYISIARKRRASFMAWIEIRRVSTGEKVFETDLREINRKLYGTDDFHVILWSGGIGSAQWSTDRKGIEYFRIGLEDPKTGHAAPTVSVHMDSWTY